MILTDEQASAVLALLFGAEGSAPARGARRRESGVITARRASRNPDSALQQRTRDAVLAALADAAAVDGLPVAEIARSTEASHSSTYDALMYLVRLGEVERRRNGHGFVYYLRPEAPAADPPPWPQATIVAGEGVTDGSV